MSKDKKRKVVINEACMEKSKKKPCGCWRGDIDEHRHWILNGIIRKYCKGNYSLRTTSRWDDNIKINLKEMKCV
jgi:hypothetical protein